MRARVLEDDECFVYEELHSSRFGGIENGEISIRKEYKTSKSFKKEQGLKNNPDWYRQAMSMRRMGYREINMKCPLEIAAPLKDFNMTNAEVKGFKISKIEIPDPIVLKPVIFNNQKHYLIVTAWGLEASDELVVNQKFN